MRIIGFGNPQRGDDAAGVIVAERLRAQSLDALTVTGDALELVEACQGADELILIDAVVTGAPAGTIHLWHGMEPLPAFTTPTSTHGIGLIQALELAHTLHRLTPHLSIWGIEGQAFEVGSVMSPEVETAIEEVTRRIAVVAIKPSRLPH